MNSPGPRRAYSYRTAAHEYSVRVSQLRRAVAAGKIRARKVDGTVLLNPEDLEREFGFSAPQPARRQPSAAARAELRELLA